MTEKSKKIFRITDVLEPGDVLIVVNRAAFALVILTIISAGLYLYNHEETWGVFFRNAIIGLVICLLLINLVKSGKLFLAAFLTLGLFSIYLLIIAWDGAGVRGLAYNLLVLVVIGSGLFIGRRAGYVTATLFILTGIGLMIASQKGWLINRDRPITDLSAFLLTSVIFFIAAYMIQIALDQVERAIAKAQHEVDERIAAEYEIQRLNLELEKRVSERTVELNASLERHRLRADEISLLYKLSNSLAAGSDLYETLSTLRNEIFELFHVDAFYVGIYHEETGMINYPIFFYRGITSPAISRRLKDNPGLSGAVILKNETLYLPDLLSPESQEKYHPVNDQSIVAHTFLGVPLVVRDKVIGLLSVQSESINAYSPEQIQLVENIALQAALAIDKATLLDELQHELRERKKLMQEMENKNAELERFTYTVSHDLRSPLVTIKGFLGLLEKDIRDGQIEKAISDFTRISNAANKMDSLLSDLLNISRIGRTQHLPETIDLNALVQDALNTVEMRISAGNVKVTVSPGLPVVYANAIRLREVFENLFDNAVKYMGGQPHPEIRVGVREGKEPVVLYVADNGMGIDPKYQEYVFDLFNKLNPASEGTGVGLAIVRRIIETTGGKIWVESEGTGKGTTFCFTVPIPPPNESKNAPTFSSS
jgi:signal transduction histidine kinase